jgi:MFS family permease
MQDRAASGTQGPLPQSIRTLGWISFFTDVASEMVYPVVPLFLVAALGAPAVVLGAMEGVAEALVCVMKGLSGWHCDRLGRRAPYVRWGYGLGALSKPLLALAFSWPLVFAARMVDRLGKGLRTTARDAMIADAAPESMAGRAFGFHRMMDTAGAILGVLLAMGLLALLPGQYRLIFLLAALPGAVAIRLAFRLRDQDGIRAACAEGPRLPLRRSLRGLPAAYWRSLALLGLFAFANSTDALLLLRAKNLGLGDVQVVAAYVLFNLTYAASAYPAGALSDRFGRWRMMFGGWTLYGLVYFGFALSGPQGLWLLFPVYGLYMGLTEGVGKAIVAVGLPPERRGTAMGFFLMVTGFATLAGSLAAGLAWDLIGPAAPFWLGGSAALLAVAAGLVLRPRARSTIAGC